VRKILIFVFFEENFKTITRSNDLRNRLLVILICRKGGKSGPSGHTGFAGGAKERTSIEFVCWCECGFV
jgi:hypothetical protein